MKWVRGQASSEQLCLPRVSVRVRVRSGFVVRGRVAAALMHKHNKRLMGSSQSTLALTPTLTLALTTLTQASQALPGAPPSPSPPPHPSPAWPPRARAASRRPRSAAASWASTEVWRSMGPPAPHPPQQRLGLGQGEAEAS